jgi:protein involved in polysaccharide export with SLBB domain
MMFFLKRLNHLLLLLGALSGAVFFGGCASEDKQISAALAKEGAGDALNETGRLRVDDALSIVFTGVPMPPDKFDGRIKEDGTIRLPLIGDVMAKGKTTGELEKEIRQLYLKANYYKDNLNVTVNAESRAFIVLGEVNNRSRQIHTGKITVLGAIAAAGGFTDFANKKNVLIIRVDGKKEHVNCVKALKNPELDVEIYPGDRIIVPRRLY